MKEAITRSADLLMALLILLTVKITNDVNYLLDVFTYQVDLAGTLQVILVYDDFINKERKTFEDPQNFKGNQVP